ncbi:MAG TPA: hypothetical protein VFD92_28580 [Candidatus Binatia bacterium]|nr:hypothetical protein [Candidatus Binatia bacterium]
MRRPLFAALLVAATLCAGLPGRALADDFMVATDSAGSPLAVRDCRMSSSELRCRVVNQSTSELRDVQLAVRRDYRWTHEFKPGSDNPGWSAIVSLREPIPPGGSVTFTYPGSFEQSRADGTFQTSVDVMSYTQVSYPGRL